MTRLLLWLLRCTAVLPLPVVRALGALLGWTLYAVVGKRRRVAQINLRLCFPHWSEQQVRACTRQCFVCFAQAWLDRGWLWYGRPAVLAQRLHLTGALAELQGQSPTVIFAPHFVGLDAGWTALTSQLPRSFATIYTDQSNKTADAWILRGRKRFAKKGLFGRVDGTKGVVAAIKAGEPLYLLPDMNFGPHESLFVPFYGVPAATVPSLSRFARLGRAKVVPVLCRMTARGYDIEVLLAWSNFPTTDANADTLRMNRELEGYINTMPPQYYWVHKRFKDRPAGEQPPY
ncbi:MAG: lipid A biosynthesis acyltransferase [Rhodoferax sp.]|nr:lipid A biosynthesis acyltransferase [Rhodoferax sp.]